MWTLFRTAADPVRSGRPRRFNTKIIKKKHQGQRTEAMLERRVAKIARFVSGECKIYE